LKGYIGSNTVARWEEWVRLTAGLESVSQKLRGLLVKRSGLALAIQGEAGLGKTHAVARLLREMPCASCSLHATTLLPQMLQAVPRGGRLPAWANRILQRFEANEEIEPEVGLRAFAALLANLAPFVLHLEDIHEASAGRLELIRLLASLIKQSKGVALVVTTRHAPPEEFEAFRLEPLSFETMRTVLEAKLQSALPLEAARWLFGRTAGHPLFALEFLKYLVGQGNLWNNGQHWVWRTPERLGLPITVEALIEEALSTAMQQPFVAQVLQTKAILPREADLDAWREVSGLEETELREGLRTLTRAGILKNDQLSHPLFQEVTLQTMPLAQKRELARRAVRAFANQPVLAVEYLPMADLPSAEQKAWLEAAVQSATSENRLSLAAELTLQSLELYDPITRTAKARAMAHKVRGVDLPKASSLFERMHVLEVADAYEWAAILAQIAQLPRALAVLEALPNTERAKREWLEHWVRTLGLGEDAARVAQAWDEHKHLQNSENATFLIIVAKSVMTLSRFEDAAQILERALHHADSDAIRAHVLLTRGRLRGYVGGSAGEYLRQALALFEQVGDSSGVAMAHYRLGIELYYQGRMRPALQHGETAMALLEKIGDQHYWTCAIMVYSVYTELGLYSEAERGLLEADAHLEQTSFQAIRVDVNTHLSYLYRYWGIPYGATLAVKFARQALRIAKEIQNPRVEANALYHLSKSETLLGHAKEGLQLADQALELANRLGFPAMQRYPYHARYQALKALGRLDEAIIDLTRAEASLRAADHLQDADFYRIELEMHHGRPLEARICLERLRQNDNQAWAQNALRLYPELEAQPIEATPIQNAHTLNVLGELRFNNESIQGRKRQELLVRLLEARITGQSGLSRLELLDTLYPSESEDRAGSRLKELIRGTRAAYGTDVIQTTANGYALGAVQSDAEDFLQLGDSSLWRGAYLQGCDFDSADVVQETLSLRLTPQLEPTLMSDPKEAARLGKIALEMNPYDLECLRFLLRALQTIENYKTLGRVYDAARARFEEVSDPLPQRWQDFLIPAKTPEKLTTA
jgi:tetratricopeptide (TPR) repeat protein